MTNQIAGYDFIELEGHPEVPRSQLTVLTRAGVDGFTIINEGMRGTPFVLRSKVDCQSMLAGEQSYRELCELIGDDPVEITWQDIDLELSYAVLDVKKVVLRALVGAVGGLNYPSLAWLECDWTLIAVDTEP